MMMAPYVPAPRSRFDPDLMADELIRMGALAKSMPPAWDGAAISHEIASPSGGVCGKMLPGRGVYLPQDLKDYGIMREDKLPNCVFGYSPVQELVDLCGGDERAAIAVFSQLKAVAGGAITTYDGIVAARAGGKGFDAVVSKPSVTTVANAYTSLLLAAGFPAAYAYVAIPGGEVPTRASVGAWSGSLVNPSGGDKKYLLTFGFTAAQQINMIILCDLLSAAGSILATSAAAQTVNSAALTRYTSGAGVLMTFEVTTLLSNTAHNMQVNKYTNQAGTTLHDTGAITGTPAAAVKRLVPVGLGPFMQLQSGDYGVQSVQEYTNSAALASGVFALNLYYPLAFVPGIAANSYVERDSTVQIDGLTELVQASAVLGCLMAYVLPNTTSSGVFTAFLRTCDG